MMSLEAQRPFIWIARGRQGGEPCIGGTRVPVDTVLRYAQDVGDTATLEAYPTLTQTDLDEARWFSRAYVDDPDASHQIEFRKDGFTIQHPLACRQNGKSLFDCPLNTVHYGGMVEPPMLGRYFCHLVDGKLAIDEEVPA